MNKRKIITALLTTSIISLASAQEIARGTVFLDLNKNGLRDPGEEGIADVVVSNGREVVQTDQTGNWQLPISEDSLIFLVKPAGYTTPFNRDMIPQYAYIYRRERGLSNDTTGEFPSAIAFPLHLSKESSHFSALLFGDPQARGLREVNFISHDVLEECIGTEAIFGVTLGDLVADDPNLFSEISQSISQIGIPWYNIFGNHDSDRQINSTHNRDKTFEHYFGPSTYAYEYGDVVFIALNNILFRPGGKYRPGFSADQIEFVSNYLSTVPESKLIVLLMHAPIIACEKKEEIFRLIENRPHSLSISSHLHEQVHLFIDEKFGWKGAQPHHHFINATVSGSWWCGLIDEVGIPHATMNDGGPNGYSIITFNGTTYRIVFKAARRPSDYQMNIYLPDDIARTGLDTTKILVNIFAGSGRSTVEMRFDSEEAWRDLRPVITIDPEILRMHKLSPYLGEKVNGQELEEIFGWKMDYPSKSRHMWQGALPGNLLVGTHRVMIRTQDMFGQTYQAHKIFRIRE